MRYAAAAAAAAVKSDKSPCLSNSMISRAGERGAGRDVERRERERAARVKERDERRLRIGVNNNPVESYDTECTKYNVLIS